MADTAGLSKPTIHLNGTSRYELERKFDNARSALLIAYDRLIEAAPHPRDYYLQGPAAYTKAEHEHQRRLDLIKEVRTELCQILESLGL